MSLIELLITVAIIALLLLVGTTGYMRFQERQKVVQAAEDFVTQLRIVQKQADTGTLSTCTDELLGYRITLSASGFIAQVEPMCTGGTNSSITLTNNSTFDSNSTFEFLTLGRGTNPTAVTLAVESTGVRWCVPITINEGGAINTEPICQCGSCP